jgi:elongation factor 1-beta
MSLKDLNGRLNTQPFLAGYTVSQEDAKAFAEMFGSNVNVIQWAARMAAYFQAERDQILTPAAPKAAAAAPAPASSSKPAAADDDSDVDLFGEETEEDKAALEAKKKADAEKKKEKKVVIAKSSILIDIKPWDDTTDLKELAAKLHAIEKDGLIWGDHKFIPVAFGIKKLQQLIVIEDDKVSGDDIEEMITGFEDHVQSMDIVAWNKI